MAVTITNIFQGSDSSINDVRKAADGDAAAVVPHGLAAIPGEVYYTPVNTVKCWTLCFPFASSIDATNINVTMGTGAGSSDASPQFRVFAKRPHSLGR